MMTQRQIAKILKITPAAVNSILKKARPVSWPIALKMMNLFGETVEYWKNANPDQFKKPFRTSTVNISENKFKQF